MLLKHKALKEVVELLGIKSSKESLLNNLVIENINSALSSFGTSRSADKRAARRALTTVIANGKMSQKKLLGVDSKKLKISKSTLVRHQTFRSRLDENDPAACWAIVCRHAHSDKISRDVRSIVTKFWEVNSRVSSNRRDVLTRIITKGNREEHQKLFLDMTQTALFHSFQETYPDVKISHRSFEKLKPWYVRPSTT